MNDERRLLIKEKLVQLEQMKESLHNLWIEEEASYESRSTASKETDQGVASKEAIEDFDRALDSIEERCEILRGIVAKP